MRINSNYFNSQCQKSQVNFQAKFLHSQSLKDIVEYAVEHDKFDKLNISRKMIDARHLKARLLVDLAVDDKGCPFMKVTKYLPNKNSSSVANSMDDYYVAKVSTITTTKKMNPLKFGLEKLIKMGNNHADNKLFERVVLRG